MKFGLLVITGIILSALAASFLLEDPGYVVIQFRGWLVEMSVPALVGLLLIGLVALWLAARLWRVPRKLGQAAGRMRASRAGQNLTRGMIAIAEGNFSRGEKLLSRSAGTSEAPLLNYLVAARAAHLQGRNERRDDWLKQAYERLPDASNAVLLTQAELQLDDRNYEAALATLKRLEESSPNHAHALALLGRLYYRLEDWKALEELLPRLRKHARVDEQTVRDWAVRVYSEKLERADADTLERAWDSVPRNLKDSGAVLEAWCRGLVRAADHDRAEKEIAAALKREWRPPLVRLYGDVEATDAAKQLKRAERWLEGRGEDPDLLLTTARLCLRNELWGKARSYLESSIAVRPMPEAYREYGRLLAQLGEGDAAADAYRAGLGLVTPVSGTAIPWLGPEPLDE